MNPHPRRCDRNPPAPADDLHFLPFADGGVLYRPGSRCLFVLNTLPALVWCELHEGATRTQLRSLLAHRFGLAPARAQRELDLILRHFSEQGLFAGSAAPIAPEPAAGSAPPPAARLPTRAPRARLALPGRTVLFSCDDEPLAEAFLRPLRHLLCPGGEGDLELAIVRDALNGERRALYVNGRPWLTGLRVRRTLPYLFTLLFVESCRGLLARLLFHSAVLVRAGRALLLPAEAGSGKTTLAAALAARGWRYYSDELAALDPLTLRVTPVPLPMSIKPGSLRPLAPYYPALGSLPAHLRADGRRVRYLPPPHVARPGAGEAAGVQTLVFPRYEAGAPTRLTPLGEIETLHRLTRTGSSERDLTRADVEAMLAVVAGSRRYELVCGALAEAVALLERETG